MSDLQTLRNEFERLAEQVCNIVAGKGSVAWQRARPSVEGVVSDAQEKGREAVDAVLHGSAMDARTTRGSPQGGAKITGV